MSAAAAQKRALDYAAGWDIDAFRGLPSPAGLTPILMPMDDHGRPVLHSSQDDDVDYYFSRIDYFDRENRVAASRNIYLIMPGYHNRPVYLPINGHTKIFEIHRGLGFLMRGEPASEDDSEEPVTAIYQLNPDVTPAVTVEANSFYAFEAPEWHHEPLVISELVTRRELQGGWPAAVPLQPRQEFVMTQQGRVYVPEDFLRGKFD